MATHKFEPGDRVTVRTSKENWNVRPGVYKVVRAMPESSDGLQYRARNVLDEHERVFNEAQLEKA